MDRVREQPSLLRHQPEWTDLSGWEPWEPQSIWPELGKEAWEGQGRWERKTGRGRERRHGGEREDGGEEGRQDGEEGKEGILGNQLEGGRSLGDAEGRGLP